MVAFDVTLEKRWSGSVSKPNIDDLRRALDELKKSDPEHPNTWLTNEAGDVLEAFEDFTMRLYNLDCPEDILTSKRLEPIEIQELWMLFAKGEVQRVRERL